MRFATVGLFSAVLVVWAISAEGAPVRALDPAIIKMYDPNNRPAAQPIQQAQQTLNVETGRVCNNGASSGCNSGCDNGGCRRGIFKLFPKPWGGCANNGNNCEGCYAHHNDLGCGSFATDCVFIFGSCRAFYGQPCNNRPGPTPWELLYGPHMATAPGVLPPGTYMSSPAYPTPSVVLPPT